jgi:hypothetical protein
MIEIVVNDVLEDGMRRVRMVSDCEIAPSPLPSPWKGEGVACRTWSDNLLGLHYAEWTWACRDVVEVHTEGMKKCRRLVMWKFLPGERVSEVITLVAEWYFVQTHRRPQFAWMQKLPKGVEYGLEVDGVMLLEDESVYPGCVMVGG